MKNDLERFQRIFVPPPENNSHSYKKWLRYADEFRSQALLVWLDSRQGKFFSITKKRFVQEEYVVWDNYNKISKINSTNQLAIILDRIEI